MAQVKFYKTSNSNLSSLPKIDGQIILVTDTGKLYIDNSSSERFEIGGGGGGGGSYTAGDHISIDSNNVISAIIPDEVVVSATQPSGNDWKLWFTPGEVGSVASEITNSYSTSNSIGYSANYFNSKVLTKDNTTSYTPTSDYQPATKKYVDENTGIGMLPVNPTITTNYNIWIETD